MSEPITLLFKWIGDHLSPKYMTFLTVLSAFLLFAPSPWLQYFHLVEFAATWRWAISLVFFVSILVLVVSLVMHVSTVFSRWVKQYKKRCSIKKHLLNLPQDQHLILSRYAESGKSTQYFDRHSLGVGDLVERNILYCWPDGLSRPVGVYPYSLTEQAMRYVLKQSEWQKILLAQKPRTRQ